MKKLGKGLFTTMKTGKVIEGFEHETKPVYGLLFHPEGHKNGGYMFRRFFCKCFDARSLCHPSPTGSQAPKHLDQSCPAHFGFPLKYIYMENVSTPVIK